MICIKNIYPNSFIYEYSQNGWKVITYICKIVGQGTSRETILI
jgi:hypothetical protein